MSEEKEKEENTNKMSRRKFIANTVMMSGLAAGYGTFGFFGGKFLYPSGDVPQQWVFVADTNTVDVGDSFIYDAPDGQKIAIARQHATGKDEDFIALSSICPHLGCQVHWQSKNQQFFCPCHNGAFSPEGKAIAGPPKDANQFLARYALKIENDLLFIKVAVPSPDSKRST